MSQQTAKRKPLEKQLAELDRPLVFGLVRQSSGDGISVEDQIARLEHEAEARGWNLLGIEVEQDVSGGRPLAKRPGLKRIVEAIEAGEVQVCASVYFDRLFRSMNTQAEVMQRVEDAGGILLPLDTGEISNATAIGELTAGMFGLIAQHTRARAREGTAVRKQLSLDRGIPPFPRITPAYQQREDGTLEPHETNAPLVREAIAMRLRGDSLLTIARFLTASGLVETERSKLGQPKTMSVRNVTQLFASRLLIGEMHFGSFEPNLNAIDEPICDRETFARLQKMSSPRGRHAKSERLLARLGILECGSCGSKMSVTTARRRQTGELYFYYRCANQLCTKRAGIPALEIEQLVLEAAKREAAGLVGSASQSVELESARLAREAAEEKLDNAVLSFVGVSSPKTREVLLQLQGELDAAAAEHERLKSLASTSEIVTPDELDDAPLEIKRQMIVDLIERAIVRHGKGDGRVEIKARSKA